MRSSRQSPSTSTTGTPAAAMPAAKLGFRTREMIPSPFQCVNHSGDDSNSPRFQRHGPGAVGQEITANARENRPAGGQRGLHDQCDSRLGANQRGAIARHSPFRT